MKFFIIGIFLIIFMQVNANDRKDIGMVNRHVNDFAAKKSREGFYLFGSGGEMMKNIKKINLYFDLHEQVSVEKARSLIVSMTEEFLSSINQDEQLRPFLNNYPFDSKNTNFTICFKDKDEHFIKEGVAAAMVLGHKILYTRFEGVGKPLQDICIESYAEALQKVKLNKKANN